ncbi:hypothetical protein BH10ACI2_BH10ACI2_00160 [soil metagenome]
MPSILVKHGYMVDTDGQTVPKPFRPKTVGDAKSIVNSIFDKNKWTERDRLKYLEMHGVEPKQVEALQPGEVRTIVAAMEQSHMVLFQN